MPYRTFRLLCIAASIGLMGLTACKKEKSSKPPREEFSVSYQFINEGDANVKSVIFSTTTFFPNDTVDARGDSTSSVIWREEAFNGVGATDIISMPLEKKGYAGCTAQLKFVVWFRNTVFSPVFYNKGWGGQNGVHPVGMTEARAYVGPVDTITSPGPHIIKFKWPSDTARFTEVLDF